MNRKILVISHTILSNKTNIGRTLLTQFSCFPKGNIAQIYFSSENVSEDSLDGVEYFRLSDREAVKSFFTKNEFGNIVKTSCEKSVKKNNKIKQYLINYLKHRSQLVYILRGFVWKYSKWFGTRLDEFIKKTNPSVIYFASGDYSFSYKIALSIAKKYNIPLVIGCYDDFYLYHKKTINPFSKIYHKHFLKVVKETFDYASCFTALCETMVTEYKEFFRKPGFTIHNSFAFNCNRFKKVDYNKNDRMVYAGNLGLGRGEILIEFAKIIERHPECGIRYIDVYSGSVGNKTFKRIKKQKNINFKGHADYKKIQEVICTTPYILHVESFDKKNIERVKYSISTKIADALNCENLLVAIGPKNVSSIEYISSNKAGVCLTSFKDMEKDIVKVLTSSYDFDIIKNAKNLALKNHVAEHNSIKLLTLLEDVVDNKIV